MSKFIITSVMGKLPATSYVRLVDIWLIFGQLVPFIEDTKLWPWFWYVYVLFFHLLKLNFFIFEFLFASLKCILGCSLHHYWALQCGRRSNQSSITKRRLWQHFLVGHDNRKIWLAFILIIRFLSDFLLWIK